MIETTRKEADTPSSAPSGADALIDFTTPGINDRIGSLRILEPIASGGMATVYKVKHEGLEVVRAIKILRPGCTAECRDRLLTEAKISANLHHPNIVQIFNVALWNGSIPYIEMEFIQGQSLRDLLADKQRLPFIVGAAIGSVICKALDFAVNQTFTVYGKEYKGLVHRDIKPANILLSSTGTVKLADFGIALPGSQSLHTSGSVIMGTIPYLSPEQLNGERLDQRSDIYSVGTVLYEIISGEKAFKQKTMGEIVKVKLDNSYNPAHTLGPDVPQPFVDIIKRSIEPDKDRRYPCAAQFAADLDEAIAKVSEQSPEEIIREYVKNRGTISIKTSPHLWKKGSNTRFLISSFAGFAGVVLLMSGAIWMLDSPRHSANRTPPPASTIPEVTASGPSAGAPADVAPVTPAPAEHLASVPAAPAPIPPPKSKLPDHPQTNPGRDGLAAFRSGHYQEAIMLLEEALKSDLPSQQAREVRLRLLESYLEEGKLETARRFSEQRIDDGYYFLLLGRLNLALEDITSAQKAFDNARTTKTSLGSIAAEIEYHTAHLHDLQFRRKPNSENRLLALEAWKGFRDQNCIYPVNRRCREAEKRVEELSR